MFYIIDLLEEDLEPLWSILSIIENKLPEISESEKLDIAFLALSSLISKQYIEVYKGVYFNGDEEIIPGFKITRDFILNHKDDWKIKEYGNVDYKFSITDKGYEAYMNGFQENR